MAGNAIDKDIRHNGYGLDTVKSEGFLPPLTKKVKAKIPLVFCNKKENSKLSIMALPTIPTTVLILT